VILSFNSGGADIAPERGWQPFIDWATDEGLDASNIFTIDVDTEAMTADVTEGKLRDGRRYVDPETGEMARSTRQVRIATLPPLHPRRSA
jgi:hypothetical protein